MDSIEQYEALLKKWGYEDLSEKKELRRQSRTAQLKKAISFVKSIQLKISNLVALMKVPSIKVTSMKVSSHKLPA